MIPAKTFPFTWKAARVRHALIDEEIKLVLEEEPRIKNGEIASFLGISYNDVSRSLRRLGIKRPKDLTKGN
jgi:hypothetical protein